MIHTHWQVWILLLEDTSQFDDVGTSAQVACFGEVAVREDMAGTEMNKMRAWSKLASHFHHIVISTCTQRTSTECQSVMLVRHGIEEPLDVLLCTYDTWQSENLDGGIVGVNTHIHVAFLADRHDSLQEVFHVLTELVLVDALIQIQELTELLNRSLVVL